LIGRERKKFPPAANVVLIESGKRRAGKKSLGARKYWRHSKAHSNRKYEAIGIRLFVKFYFTSPSHFSTQFFQAIKHGSSFQLEGIKFALRSEQSCWICAGAKFAE